MSIAALNQTYEEARRLAIAGSELAKDDFRLRRLVEPLRKSAEKAPVFGKVADQIEALVDGDAKTSPGALLDLCTLVTAVLYTQGATHVEGALEPFESDALDLLSANTSARLLKPLLEALSTTGAGRLELVRDAFDRGAFRDLRLVRPALDALDDPFPELASFVAEQVLPLYGAAIYSELHARFDPAGKSGHAWRLARMHRIDPTRTRALVDVALENGSKEVKLQALSCLEGRADALELLLDQASARAGEVRSTALSGLASLDDPRSAEAVERALVGKDAAAVVDALRSTPSARLRAFVLAELAVAVDALFGARSAAADDPTAKKSTKKTTKKSSPTTPTERTSAAADRVALLLTALVGRTDDPALDRALELLSRVDALLALPGEGGVSVLRRVAWVLLASNVPRALDALAALGPAAPPCLAGAAFTAALARWEPARAHDAFVDVYANRPSGRSKEAENARLRSDAVTGILHALAQSRRTYRPHGDELVLVASLVKAPLDPRWLDAAIGKDDVELVHALARPGHTALHDYLEARLDRAAASSAWNEETRKHDLLEAVARSQHPKLAAIVQGFFSRLLRAKTTHWYYSAYTMRAMQVLPAEAVAPLDALVDEAKDSPSLDAFVEALEALRAKHRAATS
jgi:hypothetical protein